MSWREPAGAGVTFHIPEDIGTVDIYGVSSGENAFSGDEGLYLRDNTWDFSDPQQVPGLSFAGGCGVERDPYRIATGEQFLRIAEQPSLRKGRGTHYFYELVNDVTLPDLPASMYLGSQTPYLDGKGDTVTYHMAGVLENDSGEYGLFESFPGECSNLTLAGSVDVILSGSAEGSISNFGGLAGRGTGTFSNCCSELNMTVRYDKSRNTKGRLVLAVGRLIGGIKEGNMTGCKRPFAGLDRGDPGKIY